MIISKFNRKFTVKWWKNEKLDPKLIAIDTETTLISSPSIVPELILSTVYDGLDTVYLLKNQDIKQFLEINNSALFCVWNAAFDTAVFEKTGNGLDFLIQDSRLLDGQILFRLFNIAFHGQESKKWSLDHVTELLLKEVLEKNEDIRLTFGQYLENNEVQYEKISPAHLEYACLDPIATYLCVQKILEQIKTLPTSTNLAHQINLLGDLALAQVTRNGIHINQALVGQIRDNLESEKVKNEEILATYGYVKGKKGNTKVIEEICLRENFKLPVTETGKMCTAKTYLEEYKSHSFIKAYLQFKGFSKQQNFLNDLNTPVVHPRYNSIKVTSRSSCTRPNIQQMPRLGGIRECFVPEPGHVFIDCDYSAIELASVASICLRLFKHSIMADLMNQSKDLHRYAAAQIYKVSEEDVTKEQRQTAKILNFGLVANMSAETFVNHAGKFGLSLSLADSAHLKAEWAKVFPEMAKYWKRGFGKTMVITDTGFVRANCSYTEYLNCPMQTKVAEGAKIALYSLVKSGYKVVAFIHDQVLISHPLETSERALEEVKRIMIESMAKVIIGVKIGVDGKLKDKFEK